jgi:putative transcriptional regulator
MSRTARGIIEGLKAAAAHARGEIALPVRYVEVSPAVDVRAIRARSGLTQTAFAARYGFNRRTLQDWEQGRVTPDVAVRAYLMVIDRNPAAVCDALARGAA